MANPLDPPPSTPTMNWSTMRDWLYKLWVILQGITGGQTGIVFPGNVTIDGNLVVDGTTTLQGTTTINAPVTVNSTVTNNGETVNGNLTVTGNINGTSSYTILLGVYSGLLGE
jgi:cytoskeletal protein CcmA (bactofilin family)